MACSIPPLHSLSGNIRCRLGPRWRWRTPDDTAQAPRISPTCINLIHQASLRFSSTSAFSCHEFPRSKCHPSQSDIWVHNPPTGSATTRLTPRGWIPVPLAKMIVCCRRVGGGGAPQPTPHPFPCSRVEAQRDRAEWRTGGSLVGPPAELGPRRPTRRPLRSFGS